MAKYSFIPWVREGLIQAAGGLSLGRLRLNVKARVTDASRARAGDPISPGEMFLFGPGDVTGLDTTQVIRRDPPEGTTDFEPNHFAFIEFDRPDLPWMFSLGNTSAAAGQLRPWICLVVVKKREGAVAILPASDKSLPVLEIKSGAQDELPDLAEAWAWAHAQAVLVPSVPAGVDPKPAIEDTLQHAPHRALSRLICPRRLEERTSYYACVVPTYQGGCQAGMGLRVKGEQAANDAWPWPLPNAAIRLPVYCHWEFSTSVTGDFKSMVMQLEKKELGLKDAGTRELDVNQAGYGLPAADPPVDLEGALTPDASASLRGPTDPYKARLNALLSGTASLPVSVLPPPLYGTWHAAQRAIPDGTRDRPWLRALNLDPRYRVAAGLGAQIVRDQQEQLMASAWDQLRGARDANQLIGQAQQAVMAGVPIYQERVSGLDATTFLLASQPMATRVSYSVGGVSQTAQAHVTSTALPAGTTSAQFRRLLRARGSAAMRFGLASKEKRKALVDGMNTRQLLVRPDVWPSPVGMVSAESLVGGKGPCGTDTSGLYGWAINSKTALSLLLLTQILMKVYDEAKNGGQFDTYPQPVKDKLSLGRQQLSDAFGGFRKYLLPIVGGRDSDFLNGYRKLIDALKTFLEAIQLIAPLPISIGLQLIINELNKTRNSLQSYQFGQILQQAKEKFEDCAATPQGPILPPLDIDAHQRAVLSEIDPAKVIPAILGSRIKMPGWRPEDLDFIRACPDFPAPMYRELAAQSQDWLLPGLQNMPANSVALVQGNPRFIESFMVGLNHEMSRELYWRGFPTDQRGTYFRQFWDPSGRFPAPLKREDIEAGKDIPPIHLWMNSTLGSNLGRSATGSTSAPPLVLLIRGTLLKRFPRALVTLVKARWQAGRRVAVTVDDDSDPTQIRHPVFGGELPTDIVFRGFLADREAVVGDPDPNANLPGWFIVFEQQATEPRFGLEVKKNPLPLTWRDLAWPNVSTASDTNGNVRLARGTTDFSASTPAQWHWDSAATSDSAQIASIALRRPVRVCIHASELIDLT